MERAATSDQTYARCSISCKNSHGRCSSDRTIDSQELTEHDQIVSSVTEAIVGLLSPRTVMVMAEVTAGVLDHPGTYVPEPLNEPVRRLVAAADGVYEAYKQYTKGS